MVETRYIAPGYFDVMRISLLAGEKCQERPNPAFIGALVNGSFANTYFPGSDAVGHNLRLPNPNAPPLRILGITADARETAINREPVPVFYTCATAAQPNTYFLIRTRTAPATMVETVRRKLRELEPARSVYDMAPLEERLTDAFAQNRQSRARDSSVVCAKFVAQSQRTRRLLSTHVWAFRNIERHLLRQRTNWQSWFTAC